MYEIQSIVYPNGSAQIRIYNKLIPPEGNKHTSGSNQIKCITEQKEKNLERSLRHTKAKISEYARCAVWEWFCTFTFSPEIDRTDFRLCMKKLRDYLQNVRRDYAPDLMYLVVPELHADKKNWHAHLLLAQTGKLTFTDSGRKKEGKTIYNIPRWKYGFSTATKIRDIYRVQKYIVKYMSKECYKFATGAHRFYRSNNLPQPLIKKCILPDNPEIIDNKVQEFLKELNATEIYRNEYKKDYIEVTYIELIISK